MAEIMDDVVHLTQEIGPHPAGTEEEQQAALYLAEAAQKESGFASVIEDFQCVTNYSVPALICFGVALIATIVSIVVPVAVIPCFFIVLIAAVLYVLEVINKPVISRFLRTGASQNIVAKYQPSPVGGISRRRKIVLVANYDSGKVLKDEQLPIAGALPILQKASVIALIVTALVLLLKMTVFAADTGAVSSVLTMLLLICAVLFLVPIARGILYMTAPYSQSANNNAAGVAVLLDVARQVGNGLVSNEEAMERGEREGNQIHGESAAREAGVVPEGASLEYDTAMNPQESLAAAKAAIAALTGQPVADKVPVTDISSRLVKGGGLEPVDEEAISSVHFEVSETPQPRAERKSHFRTMVSMKDEPEESIDKVQDDGAQNVRSTSTPVQKAAQSNAAAQQAAAEESAQRFATQTTPEQAGVSDAAQPYFTASFERPAPMSVVEAGFSSPSADRTPAWAKKAQAKARANKPEETQPHKVGRSRYADTVAAHMMESATERQREYEAQIAREAAERQMQESENPELAARLAALRSEIESTEAPHISDSAQAVLDNMTPQQMSDLSTDNDEMPINVTATNAQAMPDAQPVVSRYGENTQDSEDVSGSARRKVSGNTAVERSAADAVSREAGAGRVNTTVPESSADEPNTTAPLTVVSRETSEETPDETAGAVENSESGTLKSTDTAAVIDEQEELVEPEENKKSLRARMGRGASQSVRKATSNAPHAFASKLKSITSRKAVAEDEENTDPVEATEENTSSANDSFARSIHKEKAKNRVTVNEKTNTAIDAADQEKTQSVAEKTPSKNTPVSPNATAAISPIDVSQFMDKEKLDDDALVEDDQMFDAESFYMDDAFGGDVFAGAGDLDQRLANEETQRVSSEQIQEAIDEASANEPEISAAASASQGGTNRAASPIVGMESMLPQIPQVPEYSTSANQPAKRQVIVLPDVMAPHAGSGEGAKQRAPMAETNESTKVGSKALLSNMLPRIGDTGSIPSTSDGESKDTFGLDLPPLGDTGVSNTAVSATGSFSTVGATGSFAPVGDELVADIDPEERYIDDADDSAYDDEYTETGAYAGRDYVDMPKSRAGRLFGRFRKKKKDQQDDVSVNEWVNVDDSYDARSVGKARGDWSSFRQDTPDATTQIPQTSDDGFVDIDYHETDFDDRRGWNGGAFSLSRLKRNGGAGAQADSMMDSVADDMMYTEGEVHPDNLVEVNPAVRIDGDSDTAEQINRELRKLQDFRHPDIDTEVWFVALGAEQYSHSGMTAFLEEHAEEMKGAVIINLEALGAGTLSVIEQEGVYKTHRPSSRIKRFVRQASERSGISYRTAALTTRETPATLAMNQGIQAFTLAGMADKNTALYSAENDIIENIDEDMLKQASKFVMAVLKSV